MATPPQRRAAAERLGETAPEALAAERAMKRVLTEQRIGGALGIGRVARPAIVARVRDHARARD